jgi:hypothetical protein
MFPGTCLRKESVERIVTTSDGLVTWHLTIGLDAVLEAEKLPASIADLHAALSDVQAENLTHGYNKDWLEEF